MKINRPATCCGAVLGFLLLATAPVAIAPVAIAPAGAETAVEPAKADPAAYALLKAAHDSREVMPVDFPGFGADIVFNDSGRSRTGTLVYRRRGKSEVRVEGLEEEPRAWLNDQVLSIIGHRRGGDFAEGDGQHPLTLGADDGNPLGRLVQLNDGLKSTYRVRDNQVVEVTRTMGNTRFTITVLDTMRTEGGKYLPRHFMVSYFDAKTGALQSAQQFTDEYLKIGTAWLPVSRRVVTADNDGITMRVIEFRNLKLLTAEDAKATAQ